MLDLDAGAPFSGPTIDLTDRAAAQRYSDWAERLRAKRRRDQAHILGTEPDGPGSPGRSRPTGRPTTCSAATRRPTPDRRRCSPVSSDPLRCLGVLGLDPGATGDEVATAYRQPGQGPPPGPLGRGRPRRPAPPRRADAAGQRRLPRAAVAPPGLIRRPDASETGHRNAAGTRGHRCPDSVGS